MDDYEKKIRAMLIEEEERQNSLWLILIGSCMGLALIYFVLVTGWSSYTVSQSTNSVPHRTSTGIDSFKQVSQPDDDKLL